MPETTLNIYQKLAKVRKQAEVIQKNKSGYGYKYVSEDEILARISGLMDKYALSLIPTIVPETCSVREYYYKKTKATKDGKIYDENVNEILVNGEMTFTWVNNENPEEKLAVPWVLIGQQSDASQAFGSALTYSMRYFLLKFFNIATPDDDPDNWRSKQKTAAEAEDKVIVKEIVGLIDETVKAYLAENADKKDEVKAFMAVYAKDGNYKKLTDPQAASKLLEDFAAKFTPETK